MDKIKEKIIEITNMGLTDKASYHSYGEIYPVLLAKFLGKRNNILEVGIGIGGGLLILSQLFEESTIYGLDYNYSILNINIKNSNIKLLPQSENDKRFKVYNLSHIKGRGDDIIAVFENDK